MQEYERAVILRLGRIQSGTNTLRCFFSKTNSYVLGGAKGPGLFCILPCVDTMITVDLRTITFNVPPQEVRDLSYLSEIKSSRK